MKPRALIFSSYTSLALHLAEFMLSNFCEVVVYSKNTQRWVEETEHLGDNENFKIFDLEEDLYQEASYIFILEGFSEVDISDRDKIEKKIKDILEKTGETRAKKLLVLPVNLFGKVRGFQDNLVNTVYVGDLFGPRMEFPKGNLVAGMLKEAILGQPVNLPSSDVDIFPLFVGEAVKALGKLVFSYGPADRLTFLAQPTTAYSFFNLIKEVVPGTSFTKEYTDRSPYLRDGLTILRLPALSSSPLGTTLEWFRNKGLKEEPKKKDVKNLQKQKKKVRVKFRLKPKKITFAYLLLLALWIALLPFLAIFVSSFSLSLGYNAATKGRLDRAMTLFKVSEISSGFGKTFFVLSKFTLAYEVSSLLERTALVGQKAINASEKFKTLSKGVLGEKDYDLVKLSSELSLESRTLYEEISFIQSETESLPKIGSNFIPDGKKFEDARRYLSAGDRIFKRLPALLGITRPTTYLILFQNNMELRPTGGFIGSFAFVTFEKGKLVDISVSDVYTADGQLKGHVEPPKALKDYLGEANWFLRDSNWDPDFAVSAERAEWFLDKEIDRSVDGVIGVDLEVARSILEITGPLTLSDFNQQVNSQNLYEKVQHEVESDFFPGSQRKTTFMSSLAKSFLDRMKEVKDEEYLLVSRKVLDNLEGRHVQIFLHDKEASAAIDQLAWDGRVSVLTCQGNCKTVWFGIVETNLGVNKVNYYIDREVSVATSLKNNTLENKLTIVFKNNATQALGLSGMYKNYLRLLLPPEAEIEGDFDITQVAGRKEVGLLVEVTPGLRKEVDFIWKLPTTVDISRPGEIILVNRKQAGVAPYTFNSKFILPSGISFFSDPAYSLTNGGGFSYNTLLARDFISRIFW